MALAMQCKSLVLEARNKRVSDVTARLHWLASPALSAPRLHEARKTSRAAGTVMSFCAAYLHHGLDDGNSGRAATFWVRAEVLTLLSSSIRTALNSGSQPQES